MLTEAGAKAAALPARRATIAVFIFRYLNYYANNDEILGGGRKEAGAEEGGEQARTAISSAVEVSCLRICSGASSKIKKNRVEINFALGRESLKGANGAHARGNGRTGETQRGPQLPCLP